MQSITNRSTTTTTSSTSSFSSSSSSSSSTASPYIRRIISYDVYFPLTTPLPSQLALMTRVLTALQNKQNALLESPTGTGKTLALLCATLAYQHAQRAEKINSVKQEYSEKYNDQCVQIKQLENQIMQKKIELGRLQSSISSGSSSLLNPLPTISTAANNSTTTVAVRTEVGGMGDDDDPMEPLMVIQPPLLPVPLVRSTNITDESVSLQALLSQYRYPGTNTTVTNPTTDISPITVLSSSSSSSLSTHYDGPPTTAEDHDENPEDLSLTAPSTLTPFHTRDPIATDNSTHFMASSVRLSTLSSSSSSSSSSISTTTVSNIVHSTTEETTVLLPPTIHTTNPSSTTSTIMVSYPLQKCEEELKLLQNKLLTIRQQAEANLSLINSSTSFDQILLAREEALKNTAAGTDAVPPRRNRTKEVPEEDKKSVYTGPVIYYASRTHTQLAQVVKELRRCQYYTGEEWAWIHKHSNKQQHEPTEDNENDQLSGPVSFSSSTLQSSLPVALSSIPVPTKAGTTTDSSSSSPGSAPLHTSLIPPFFCMTMLSSRKQSCVHPCVNPKAPGYKAANAVKHTDGVTRLSVDDGCRKLIDKNQCAFMPNNKNLVEYLTEQLRTWDIEEVVNISSTISQKVMTSFNPGSTVLSHLGRSAHGCPYFSARDIYSKNASIIFLPYNYLLSPGIREAMKIDLQNTIIILDEAHNLEDTCRESASGTFTMDDFVYVQENLKSLVEKDILVAAHQIIYDMVSNIILWFETNLKVLDFRKELERILQPLNQNNHHHHQRNSSSSSSSSASGNRNPSAPLEHVWKGNEILSIFSQFRITLETYTVLLESLIDIEEYINSAAVDDPQINSRSLTVLRQLLTITGFIVTPSVASRGKATYANDYRIVITVEPPTDRSMINWYQSTNFNACFKLNFWCMNPAVVFDEIASQADSILCTSGTLAPLDSFAGELGAPFPIRLEAPPAIQPQQQVFSSVLSTAWSPNDIDIVLVPPQKKIHLNAPYPYTNGNTWPWHIISRYPDENAAPNPHLHNLAKPFELNKAFAQPFREPKLRITGTYKFLHEENGLQDYLIGLGTNIITLCTRTPGGILVFFPSYRLLDQCMDCWKRNHIRIYEPLETASNARLQNGPLASVASMAGMYQSNCVTIWDAIERIKVRYLENANPASLAGPNFRKTNYNENKDSNDTEKTEKEKEDFLILLKSFRLAVDMTRHGATTGRNATGSFAETQTTVDSVRTEQERLSNLRDKYLKKYESKHEYVWIPGPWSKENTEENRSNEDNSTKDSKTTQKRSRKQKNDNTNTNNTNHTNTDSGSTTITNRSQPSIQDMLRTPSSATTINDDKNSRPRIPRLYFPVPPFPYGEDEMKRHNMDPLLLAGSGKRRGAPNGSLGSTLKTNDNGSSKQEIPMPRILPHQTGAIMFAVFRGKASEGIDFSDEHCRTVVLVGVPYPPLHDPLIKLKREYQDTWSKLSHSSAINGNVWYSQQAFRALNQGIGRAIRHRFDYGSIILMDSRFTDPTTVQQLSRWVRPVIRTQGTVPYDYLPSSIPSRPNHSSNNTEGSSRVVSLPETINKLDIFYTHLQNHPPERNTQLGGIRTIFTSLATCKCPCSHCTNVCRNSVPITTTEVQRSTTMISNGTVLSSSSASSSSSSSSSSSLLPLPLPRRPVEPEELIDDIIAGTGLMAPLGILIWKDLAYQASFDQALIEQYRRLANYFVMKHLTPGPGQPVVPRSVTVKRIKETIMTRFTHRLRNMYEELVRNSTRTNIAPQYPLSVWSEGSLKPLSSSLPLMEQTYVPPKEPPPQFVVLPKEDRDASSTLPSNNQGSNSSPHESTNNHGENSRALSLTWDGLSPTVKSITLHSLPNASGFTAYEPKTSKVRPSSNTLIPNQIEQLARKTKRKSTPSTTTVRTLGSLPTLSTLRTIPTITSSSSSSSSSTSPIDGVVTPRLSGGIIDIPDDDDDDEMYTENYNPYDNGANIDDDDQEIDDDDDNENLALTLPRPSSSSSSSSSKSSTVQPIDIFDSEEEEYIHSTHNFMREEEEDNDNFDDANVSENMRNDEADTNQRTPISPSRRRNNDRDDEEEGDFKDNEDYSLNALHTSNSSLSPTNTTNESVILISEHQLPRMTNTFHAVSERSKFEIISISSNDTSRISSSSSSQPLLSVTNASSGTSTAKSSTYRKGYVNILYDEEEE